MSTLITGQSPNEPKNDSVKYLHRVSDSVIGQLPIEPNINL